ncbi:MAG: hypothetical protein WAL78_04515, partial [Candidatus Acidiferrales bacterium]
AKDNHEDDAKNENEAGHCHDEDSHACEATASMIEKTRFDRIADAALEMDRSVFSLAFIALAVKASLNAGCRPK